MTEPTVLEEKMIANDQDFASTRTKLKTWNDSWCTVCACHLCLLPSTDHRNLLSVTTHVAFLFKISVKKFRVFFKHFHLAPYTSGLRLYLY